MDSTDMRMLSRRRCQRDLCGVHYNYDNMRMVNVHDDAWAKAIAVVYDECTISSHWFRIRRKGYSRLSG